MENKGDASSSMRVVSAKVFLEEALLMWLGTMKKTYIIMLVTTASKQEAEKIAQHLLEAKLIACANIVGPVCSLFRWVGKVERAEEHLVLMKTREDLFEKVAEAVRALHSYDVPEILALPIVDGSKGYVDWLESCLK